MFDACVSDDDSDFDASALLDSTSEEEDFAEGITERTAFLSPAGISTHERHDYTGKHSPNKTLSSSSRGSRSRRHRERMNTEQRHHRDSHQHRGGKKRRSVRLFFKK